MSEAFTVYFGTNTAEVLREADRMIREARDWIGSDEMLALYAPELVSQPFWNELHAKVNDMELSWLRSLKWLIQMAGQTGNIRLTWDSQRSLLFQEPKSGLVGGLIFHANYIGDRPTPIGSWSLHT